METIGGLLTYLLGTKWRTDEDLMRWPPYWFAATALILKKSGAYVRVLRNWPPNEAGNSWHESVKKSAWSWRETIENVAGSSKKINAPHEVKRLTRIVRNSAAVCISDIEKNDELSTALIKILSIADEASIGLGLPSRGEGKQQRIQHVAFKALNSHGTLTPDIARTIVSVLPKHHTPTGGLSLRSMSHHLALHVGSDSYARWLHAPRVNGSQMNVLVVPWPLKVRPYQFKEAELSEYEFARGFGGFDLVADEDGGDPVDFLKGLLENAFKTCRKIDAVIFPEASLSPEQFEKISINVRQYNAFLVAGVQTRGENGCPPRNQVWVRLGITNTRYEQDKHHRWRLDRRQIEMYGIGGALNPDIEWWEYIGVQSRAINFLALDTDFTMCCLVCEDLARQEPVGELVRAVGPNLVIALLADGPQLAQRWPARYATVLADDPGSSVLTVTSLGMAQLAKPPAGVSRSRSVALWKDAMGNVEEIVLPPESVAAVLNLRARKRPEWTADGRCDMEASCPQLVGVHFVEAKR